MLNNTVLEVVRRRGSEVYHGRTATDTAVLQMIFHSNYFYRAAYSAILGTLTQFGYCLLVEEPFDEAGSKQAEIPGAEGDLWVP